VHRPLLGSLLSLREAHPIALGQKLHVHLDRSRAKTVPRERRSALCAVGQQSSADRETPRDRVDPEGGITSVRKGTGKLENGFGSTTGGEQTHPHSNGQVTLHVRGMFL
jgi:hypothetical protein